MFRILTAISVFIILSLTLLVNQSYSKLYQWIDEENKKHYANELYVIPEKYKNKVIEVNPITRQPLQQPVTQPPIILPPDFNEQMKKNIQTIVKQIPKPQISNPPIIDKNLKTQLKAAMLKASTGFIFLTSISILIFIGILILIIKFIVYRVYKEKEKYEIKKPENYKDTDFKF